MSEPTYTPSYGQIPKYMKKFQSVGVPPKVDRKWLAQMGFPGGNHYYVVRVLKYIGLLGQTNVPTELWKGYKNPSQAKSIMAMAIRNGYSALFNIYEDAYRKDKEAIYAVFSTTGKAEATINAMVGTFFALCDLADFEAEPVKVVSKVEPEPTIRQPSQTSLKVNDRRSVPEIHINIQLVLPETTDTSVYDRLFESLKKHLLTDEE